MSYKKIIEKYAMEFSSSPILCTVSESIETLEGRDEWALEADTFSTREESPNKETKVNERKKKKATAADPPACSPPPSKHITDHHRALLTAPSERERRRIIRILWG